MIRDHIGDLITRLRNAGAVRKESVTLPHSNFKSAVLDTLVRAGFVKAHTKKGKKAGKLLEVELLYEGDTPRITGARQISRVSKRVYRKSSEIRQVRNGYGSLIISTPNGVLTDVEARKANVGGEALFEIW